MDNLPFNATGLCAEDVGRFHDTYKALKESFNIQSTGNIDFNLTNFELFKNYVDIGVRNSYVIKQEDDNNDSYILFVSAHLKHVDHKGILSDKYECQTWALAFLKHDFGRVLIRRETLADKLIEFIHPVELDFVEDKAFSDTFYVLVNDRKKALNGMDRHFRNAVMDIRDDHFIIEIIEHTLIIGSKKPISADHAVHLAEFVERLCQTCY